MTPFILYLVISYLMQIGIYAGQPDTERSMLSEVFLYLCAPIIVPIFIGYKLMTIK